jgi:hypothetical protein
MPEADAATHGSSLLYLKCHSFPRNGASRYMVINLKSRLLLALSTVSRASWGVVGMFGPEAAVCPRLGADKHFDGQKGPSSLHTNY